MTVEVLHQSDTPEPQPTAQALHNYVNRYWTDNQGLIYYHQTNMLMVRLPGGKVEWVSVTAEEIEGLAEPEVS